MKINYNRQGKWPLKCLCTKIKMLKISWTDNSTNEKAYERLRQKEKFGTILKKNRIELIGHLLRHQSILKVQWRAKVQDHNICIWNKSWRIWSVEVRRNEKKRIEQRIPANQSKDWKPRTNILTHITGVLILTRTMKCKETHSCWMGRRWKNR